jgi:recombination protein RecA
MASAALRAQLEEALRTRFAAPVAMPATRLGDRPAAETLATGIAALDSICGGLPRGALSEIVGRESSGRTSLLVSVLAQARAGYSALIDATDTFDPRGAEAAGVELEKLLWIRGSCQPSAVSRQGFRETGKRKRETPDYARLEQALKAADFLLQAGGFGLLVLDLAGLPPEVTRRVPLTSWFRFRRVVEHTPTVLLVLEQEPHAKTCASLVVELKQSAISIQHSASHDLPETGNWKLETPSHTQLLTGFSVEVELLRSAQRKPARAAFAIGERRAG